MQLRVIAENQLHHDVCGKTCKSKRRARAGNSLAKERERGGRESSLDWSSGCRVEGSEFMLSSCWNVHTDGESF